MPSAVLDSTVLISAFLAQRGVSNQLLRHAREGAFLLCLSEEILEEAQGVLLDEERRHRQRYHYPNEEAINFIDGLRAFAHLVTDWLFRYVITASRQRRFRPIPNESASGSIGSEPTHPAR